MIRIKFPNLNVGRDVPKGNPQFTKRGPGRRHVGKANASRGPLASGKRVSPPKGRQHKHQLRDEHGAFTLVGFDVNSLFDHVPRKRKWLAGISSQRGY